MRIFDILHIIFLSSVGVGGNASTTIFMMPIAVSLWGIANHCYSLIKDKKLVGIAAILLPTTFAFVYIIITGSSFDYFLANNQEPHIINFVKRNMHTTQFMYEIAILSVVFLISLFIYCKLRKPRLLEFVIGFLIEVVTIVAFVVLYGGLFIDHFTHHVVAVSENNFLLIKFFLYGVSCLILKAFATIVAISLKFLLRERKIVHEEESYYQIDFYEKEVLRFLKKDLKSTSIILYVMYIVFVAVFIWLFIINGKTLDIGIILFITSLPFLLMGLFLTHKVKMVEKSTIFNQLKMRGDRRILKQFHDEIILNNYHSKVIGFNEYILTSNTFTVHKTGALFKSVIIKEEH